MARSLHNHERKIESRQVGNLKLLQKGMIIDFNYKSPNAFNKKPLILFIWRDKNVIHGLNLNYLDTYKFKRLFKILGMETPVEEKSAKSSRKLNEEYTRVNLPAFKRERDGDKLSKSEAKVEMINIYKKIIKPKLLGDDIYRTYSVKNISSIKVINLKQEKKLVKGEDNEINEEVENNEN